MKRHLVFHRLAEQDAERAIACYSALRMALARGFLDELARALLRISEGPESAPRITAVVRRRLLRRYPYAVIYRDAATEIRILAVAHLARIPDYWTDRDC